MNSWRPTLGRITTLVFWFGLLLSPTENATARDCTCRKIGFGVCVPDPACLAGQQINPDVGRAIEKAAQDTGKTIEKSVSRLIILETGYSPLPQMGTEEGGYGLYSYAVLTSPSNRSSAFLSEVFKSIPAIEDTAAARSQLNIFYIPMLQAKGGEFADSVSSLEKEPEKLGNKFSVSYYDYKMARAILDHICNPPEADTMREFCGGDMARGPYIFAYANPASKLEPVPPPYLLVDLSDVDPRAFGEFVSAFRAQVKRDDITDGARVNSLRLKILQIVLKAGDLVGPIQKSIADIMRSTSPSESGK